MYTLIRENRGKGPKLEILVYGTLSEAIMESLMYWQRLSSLKIFKNQEYQLYNAVLDNEFFKRNSNWRWDEFKNLLFNQNISVVEAIEINREIEHISMLIENTEWKSFEECDKIFSILIRGKLDDKNLKKLKKVSEYIEVKNEIICCDKCTRLFQIPSSNSKYRYYANNLKNTCFEIKKNNKRKYLEARGYYNVDISINWNKNKYKVGNKFCENCINGINKNEFQLTGIN